MDLVWCIMKIIWNVRRMAFQHYFLISPKFMMMNKRDIPNRWSWTLMARGLEVKARRMAHPHARNSSTLISPICLLILLCWSGILLLVMEMAYIHAHNVHINVKVKRLWNYINELIIPLNPIVVHTASTGLQKNITFRFIFVLTLGKSHFHVHTAHLGQPIEVI